MKMKLRTVCALCASSALTVAAIAAPGASAQTMYECASTAAGATFNDAHCKETKAGGSGFQHVTVAEKTAKSVSITNNTTGTGTSILRLKSVQGMMNTLEIQAAKVTGSFTLENLSAGLEMWSAGKGKLTLESVTVAVPSGNNCTIQGSGGVEGVLPTKELFLTNRGLTNEWDLQEVPGAETNTLLEFRIEKCNNGELNGNYTVNGTVKSKTQGTTMVYEHGVITKQATLSENSKVAGLEGSPTPKFSVSGNGIALT